MLRALHDQQCGYQLNGQDIDVLAYADDIILVSKSSVRLHDMLDVVTTVASWSGLDLAFNAKKCASLVLDGQQRGAVPTQHSIQGQKMKSLEEDDTYEHLGVPTGYHRAPSAEDALQKMTNHVESIDKSLLAPWQKADAVNTFVLPCLSFHLKNGIVPKKPLTVFDRKLKVACKRWLNLPSRASNKVLYPFLHNKT